MAVAPADYRPGLDGLRALAVTAVVVFHLGHLAGGNLGVDAFFVLSGWLITWKLLAEADHRPHGAPVALGRFWSARARRLLPASLLVLASVAVVWPLVGVHVTSLRRDLVFATFWSSNWGTITGGGDYWSHFGEPSPLTHYWSLAVEEQFYLVWPLLLSGAVLLWRRRSRLAVGVLATGLAVTSIVLMNVWFRAADPTATYLNTVARAHSLLIGAVAATITRPLPDGGLRGGAVARRLAPVAALASIAVVAAAREGSTWLFRWGFPLFAVLMSVVVVAAADGWCRRVLAAGPMRWLSDRSYALYLWHWPVIVLLSADRTGLHGPLLDLARVAVSVGLAHVSLRLVEAPVRRRERLRGRWAPAAAATAFAGITVLALGVVPGAASTEAAPVVTLPPAPVATPTTAATDQAAGTDGTTDIDDRSPSSGRPVLSPLAAEDVIDVNGAVPAPEVASAGPAPAVPALPVRVLVAGDSTAQHLAEALVPYAAEHPDQLVAGSAAFPGCGLTASDDGRMHRFTDRDGTRKELDLSGCLNEWTSIPERVAGAEQIDVVLVSIGPWDAVDIRLADGSVVSVADPVGRALVVDAYTDFVRRVTDAGGTVVWITPPDTHLGWGEIDDPVNDPVRWDAIRSIIDDLGVTQIDLAGWLVTHGLDGQDGRPDGVHLSDDADRLFVEDAVAPALVALAQRAATA